MGCGPGWETATFAAADLETLGLDITPSFLAAARERAPTAAILRGDMRSLPVATDSVDGVFALASLLHVPRTDVGDALEEFARVLGPEGVLTVVVKQTDRTAVDSPYGEADRRHFEYYDEDTLRQHVGDAGFTVEASGATDGWILVDGHRPSRDETR